MTFVVVAAQALECATELRTQDGDSAGRNAGAGWPNAEPVPDRLGKTKKEQIRISIVFQLVVTPCQMRTKKVQNARDYGLSGLH
ncbi:MULTISPECIES: hypothetical protein [unclassified Mesorhizobium]|uniref:hypothetical protein n=1 Tax=unclassified Mesorhizobium TaxID=325217 RepID=UPI000FCA2005|nr:MULTISPECIES: hypothetical protein [unclassified Mesorhizobium]TGU93304.1 hypothetical protein EN794_033180 [Mesorhizobium sp. M00.F.Ca.ET.151.01.1.1]TGV55153.1 hypothetical protein EN784_32345 [bacterium M00.F.Ca.ET.141.01.1.1]TIS88162.1 MAG: hypothetical protein E5W88_23285 [Mesorhizobium sp.]RUW49263.1 hypothetical protein EOA36_19010 [Mesorhizobium sp. M8A.F.Ca.ET.021.01.1.1]TGP96062.1 hypothetical protein EN861_14445 [Mesorhizobium sp. M8A.F.Ca.ET.218.01.1.1]